MKALVIRALLLSLALASSPGRADAPGVVVDAVVVANHTPLRDALITSALDLTLGKELSREELDERLAQGKARLEALGYFRTVDLKLEKGTQRGHYRVVVALEQESARYAGFGYTHEINRYNIDGINRDTNEIYEAYAGSRDVAGTGLQMELDFTRMTEGNTSDYSGGQALSATAGRQSVGQLSLLNPDVRGTPWFAGAIATYVDYSNESLDSDSSGMTNDDESTGVALQAIVGRHVGLFTLSLGIERSLYWSHFHFGGSEVDIGDSHSLNTAVTSLACYSDKSGLTVVEPGYTLCADTTRSYAPKTSKPVIDTEALYTLILGGRHAITPSAYTEEYWFDAATSDDGGKTYHPYYPYSADYDLSLKYEFVPMDHLILGAEYGEMHAFPAISRPWATIASRHRTFTMTYTSPTVLLQFAVIYGTPGLASQDSLILERQGQKRLAQ